MDPNCIIKCGDLDPNAFGLTAGGQVTLNGMLPGPIDLCPAVKHCETDTTIDSIILNGTTLEIRYTGEDGVQQLQTVSLASLAIDINVTSLTYNPVTGEITLVETDGTNHVIDIGPFVVTASGLAVATSTPTGVDISVSCEDVQDCVGTMFADTGFIYNDGANKLTTGGTTGQVLQSNGAGVATWVTPAAAAQTPNTSPYNTILTTGTNGHTLDVNDFGVAPIMCGGIYSGANANSQLAQIYHDFTGKLFTKIPAQDTATSGTIINNDYLVGMFSAVFPDATYDYGSGYHPEPIVGTLTTTVINNPSACRDVLITFMGTGANINITNITGATGDLALSIGQMWQINGGGFNSMASGVGATDCAIQNLLKVAGDEISLNSEAFFFSVVVPAGGNVTVNFQKYVSLRSSVPATAETTFFTESQPSKVHYTIQTI